MFRKRPIFGNRILTLAGEQERRDREKRERQERERQEQEKMAALRENEKQIFRERRPMLGNRILHPIKDNLEPQPPKEPSPMDLAMEEIRAAQKQREEQAALFEQMMGGAFKMLPEEW